ncbi:MAG: biotin transporter BioY [Chloroflexi bacterium]|nr:biotin transporter BioY [Chloroflexota bacterium]
MYSTARARSMSRSWASLLWGALLVVSGAAFVAVCSQISVPLPFTPVPITAQTLGVLLTGAMLGSRRGGLALLLYLAEGLAGMPVFQAGHSGLPYAMGPTGGYLAGFVVAAFVVGWLTERGFGRTPLHLALALLAGTLAIYALGVWWLGIVLSVPVERALALGVAPFLLGDALKVALAALVVPAGRSLLGHFRT